MRIGITTSIATAIAVGVLIASSGGATITCDQSSTNAADFTTDLAAISNGQTLCLTNAVDYGTFSGTNKNITIIAQSGSGARSPVDASMDLNFGSGDSGFTIDGNRATWAASTGLTINGGDIKGASNVTIKNSAFEDILNFDLVNENIIIDNNTFDWPSESGGLNAHIFLGDTGRNHTLAAPAVTVKNSHISGGELDGIHFGDSGSGYLILNNTFEDLCDIGLNHTDNIQVGANDPRIIEVRIAGNYINASSGCETQAITSYDNGTQGFIIENNVVDVIGRSWSIEWYGDVDSIIRHNTLIWHPGSSCTSGTIPCGRIDIGHKTDPPLDPSSGTHVYDNIATGVDDADCTTCTIDHNVSGQTAVYVGPTTSHDGFLLAANSPVGKNASSTGTDDGVCTNTPAGGCP